MAEALTLFIVVAVATIIAVKLWLANRREGKRLAQAARDAEERRRKEEEVLAQVRELKNRDVRERAAAAIQRDPERAARVVSNMLKDKKTDG